MTLLITFPPNNVPLPLEYIEQGNPLRVTQSVSPLGGSIEKFPFPNPSFLHSQVPGFFKKIFIYFVFIYLAAAGLSCRLVAACELLVVACEI